jgi:hypothetical protein
VVQARRDEVRRVIERGIARDDLRSDADARIATELLVGPVYFRVMFGGKLDLEFANRVVDSVIRGYAAQTAQTTSSASSPKQRKRKGKHKR